MVKVSREELQALKAGESLICHCKDFNACESLKQRAYRENYLAPHKDTRLKCSTDGKKCKVTITAVSTETSNQSES